MHGAGGEELLVQRRVDLWSKGRRELWAGGVAYPLTASPKWQVSHPDFTIRRDPKAQEELELGADLMGL